MGAILAPVLRLLMIVAGLVFALSLMAAAAFVLALAGLRVLWCKLTGRPVTPWAVRIDPRAGFAFAMRSGAGRPGARPDAANSDVIDVEVRDTTDATDKLPRR